jgi:hypothetical protein
VLAVDIRGLKQTGIRRKTTTREVKDRISAAVCMVLTYSSA